MARTGAQATADARAGAGPGTRPGAGSGLRTLPAALVAVAGGLALAAAFPPTGIWPLAAVGPALLVVALWQRSLRGSFGIGLCFGLAFFVPLISWLVNVAWYVWAALAVSEAVIFAVFAIGQRLMLRLPGWPAAVACWWVAVEGFRDRWPYAFPWGRLAMSQAQAPTVRWVSVGGPPLLTFLVALAGTTLAWMLVAPHVAGTPIRRRAVPALAFAAAAGLALAGGLLPSGQPGAGTPTAEVAAVQGNVPHSKTLQKLLRETTVTENHAAATEQLAAQVKAGSRPAPDVVIWPENSTDIDPGLDPFVYATIAGAVGAVDRPVLVGAVLQDPLRNAGELWLPGRGPVAIYVKRQLVPFGEYIPFRGLICSIQLAAVAAAGQLHGRAPRGGVPDREDQARRRDLLRGRLRQPGLVRGQRGREPAHRADERRGLRAGRPAGRDAAAAGHGPDPRDRVRPRHGRRGHDRGQRDHRAGRGPDRPAAGPGSGPSSRPGCRC